MLTGIYTKNRHGKNIYMFRVGVYPFKIWLYVLNSREAAEASHRQIAGIKSEVDTIFAFIRAGLEYDKIEPHAKILAELVRGTWPPDKLYDYLKMLFLLSGPEEEKWFCYVALCRLALYKDTGYMQSPVIRRYEERFAYLEERLQVEGKLLELAYAQVARDTGFRLSEMDFLEWEDVVYPKIMLRIPRKTSNENMFGLISEKTYETLQKLDHPSQRIFNNAGKHLRMNISSVSDGDFRFTDYRQCYQLKVIWNEILNSTGPVSGKGKA